MMYMQKVAVLVLAINLVVLLLPIFLVAQTTFERFYDGEMGRSVQQTEDGGYIIAGNSGGDFHLIKTDSLGDTLWTRRYGGGSSDIAREVHQTTDGGYIIGGQTMSYGAGGWDYWLIKTDSQGDTLWTKTYGGSGQDWGKSVKQTNDGGYIFAGRYCSGLFGLGLIKTDSLGNLLWIRAYSCGYNAEGYSVQQTTDGGYIVTGEVIIDNTDQQFYLVKTNSIGDTLWTRIFGWNNSAEIAYSVQQTNDGGYIISGFTIVFMGSCNVYLVKTDSSGNVLWTRTHNFGGNTNEAHSIQQTVDGGYIYTGFTNGAESPGDVLLVKTDSQGNVLWSNLYGRIGFSDNAFSVQQTADEGYIFTGFTGPNTYTSDYIYLVKTDSLGNVTGTGIENQTDDIPQKIYLSQNYPNPFNPSGTGRSPETKIKYSIPKNGKVELKIYNIKGQLVKTLIDEKKIKGKYAVIWDGKNYTGNSVSSGIYFYYLETQSQEGTSISTKKMILLR